MSPAYGIKGVKGQSMASLTNKAEVWDGLVWMEDDVQAAVIGMLLVACKEISSKLRATLPKGSGEPSAPGALPYSQTDELKNAITYEVLPPLWKKPITAVVYVGSEGFHGRMLEFGTSKMAARPWFYPFLLRQNPEMRKAILEGLESEIYRRSRMRGTYIRRGRMDEAMAESLFQRDISYMESL